MIKLLLKDLGITRPFWIPSLAVYVVIAASYFRAGLIYLLANMVLTLACVVLIPVLDDTCKGDSLFCSLPVRRTEVVLARYVTSFALILLGLLLYIVLGYLLGILLSGYTTRPLPTVSMAGTLLFLLLTISLTLLFLPLYFSLGVGRALIAFPALLAVAAALLWGLLRLLSLAPDIPFFPLTEQDRALAEERVRALDGPGMEALLWKAKILGAGLLASIVAALTWLSATCSIFLFKRRNL